MIGTLARLAVLYMDTFDKFVPSCIKEKALDLALGPEDPYYTPIPDPELPERHV